MRHRHTQLAALVVAALIVICCVVFAVAQT